MYLSTGAFEQVLGETTRVLEEHVDRKPVAHALAVAEVEAQRVVPVVRCATVDTTK